MKIIGLWGFFFFLLLMHAESRFLSLVTELFWKEMPLTNSATKSPSVSKATQACARLVGCLLILSARVCGLAVMPSP